MSEKWVPRELILAHLEMHVVYFTCDLQNLNQEKNNRAFSVDERLFNFYRQPEGGGARKMASPCKKIEFGSYIE